MKTKLILLFLSLLFSFSAFSQSALTDSLIAYYPFNGNANDASGNGNNGTVIGATLTADRFGNANSAYLFNSSNNDYIDITPGTNFKPTTYPASFTAWIKSNNPSIANVFLNDETFPYGNYSGFQTQVNIPYNNYQAVGIGIGDGTADNPSARRSKFGTINVNDNQWHFIAAVFNGLTDMDIYVDCRYDTSAAYNGSGGALHYAGNHGSIGLGFNGIIDEVRFYHSGLTQADLQAIYSYPKPFDGLSVTLPKDTTFCQGNQLFLVPNTTGNVLKYNWSNGATTTIIQVTTPGAYSLQVFDGCAYASDTINVTSGKDKAGIITATRDTVCDGSSTHLIDNGISGTPVEWQNATTGNYTVINGVIDTSYSTQPLTQTTYYRVIVGNGTCMDTSNVQAIMIPPALFDSFTVTKNGLQVNFTYTGDQDGVTAFQWNFGDSSESQQMNPNHTYKSNGTYQVCVTIYNGSNCSFTYCQPVTIGTEGIAEVNADKNWKVYPMPLSDNLFISAINNNSQIKSLQFYDVLGRLILTKPISNGYDNPLQINCAELNAGFYLLKIKTDKQDYILPVTKQ